jgi:hypothetical protein
VLTRHETGRTEPVVSARRVRLPIYTNMPVIFLHKGATGILFNLPCEVLRRSTAKLVVPLDSIAPSALAWLAGSGSGNMALNKAKGRRD